MIKSPCARLHRVTVRPTLPGGVGGDGEPVVLVIDDDVAMRESLTSLFQSVGLRVRVFGSAPELLQSSLPNAPSCLVLDIRLPGMSGLDFQIELAKSGIHIPIIFMTGHGDIPMSVQAMKAGAVDFLTKPFRHQEMLHAVTQALDCGSKETGGREDGFGSAIVVRVADSPRARGVGPRYCRHDEQADCGGTGRQRDHGKGPSQPCNAKNAHSVAGRSGTNRRHSWDSTRQTETQLNLSITF